MHAAQFKVGLFFFLNLYYYSNVVASGYQKSQTKLHKFEIFSERMEWSVVDGLTSVDPFIVDVHWL